MKGKVMIESLRDKKGIFFDVGYTLAYPSSGDWMFTHKFSELAEKQLNKHTPEEIQNALEVGHENLNSSHLVFTVEEEYRQFVNFYSIISKSLDLGLTQDEVNSVAYDRTYNMDNYAAYPDVQRVLKTLSMSYRLGVISDTWPSIELQLQALGVKEFFSSFTYSCSLGVFKPDERMYIDALEKIGLKAEDTVFIDDSINNLEGAAKLGITPILIASNPSSDAESSFLKIHSLSELLE